MQFDTTRLHALHRTCMCVYCKFHEFLSSIQLIQLRLSRSKEKKVENEREMHASREWRLKIHKPNKILSLGIPIVVICIHKKARFSFKLSRKPVNGNKTSHSRQAFRAHIRPFPFSSGQP